MGRVHSIQESTTRPNVIRIIVADDFTEWRVRVRELLKERPDWQIVSEVSDGLAAVHKIEELHPDVVLLDIAMPGLNGLGAAQANPGGLTHLKYYFRDAEL